MRKASKLSLAAAAVLALATMGPAAFACSEHLQSSLNIVPIHTVSDLSANAIIEPFAPRILESAVVVSPAIQTEAWMGPIISPAFPAPSITTMLETRTVAQPVVIQSTCNSCMF
jgi:hypothetical protein